MPTVVYDAGALVAADRRDPRFFKLHERLQREGHDLIAPLPAYVQVYRGDPRQHSLNVLMRGVQLHRGDRLIAQLAGRALRLSGTVDAVDALVAATAVTYSAAVVTSDPDDIRHLLDSLDHPKLPILTP